MVDPMDDIARQARQGSVAAIIQVLNEKLAHSGVRTRAILADGVLQLLCEAPRTEQLEQSSLVERIRNLLESLSPRNIRRVNINSRIAREQQLLWLEEINRDPENQLLWSQEIVLRRPNPISRLMSGLQERKTQRKSTLPKMLSAQLARERRQFHRGLLLGGVGLCVFIVLCSWALYAWLQPTRADRSTASDDAPSATETATPVSEAQDPDPFVKAVRIAERAAQASQKAQTRAEWLEIASQWQKASDLMAQVPQDDPRYQTASDRTERYSEYSSIAEQEAQKASAATQSN